MLWGGGGMRVPVLIRREADRRRCFLISAGEEERLFED